MNADRPLADPGRENSALQLFPFREMTAEQYAAWYAHTCACSSFDQYRYSDSALGAWIDELHRIMRSAEELERCRRTHLSGEEYAAVQREIADSAEFGL